MGLAARSCIWSAAPAGPRLGAAFARASCRRSSLPGAAAPRSGGSNTGDASLKAPSAFGPARVPPTWPLAVDTSTSIATASKTGTPLALSTSSCKGPHSHRSPMFQAHNFFFAHELQNPVLEQRLRQHLLELRVFTLQLFQPLCFVDLHLPEPLLPPVKRHLRNVRLPNHFPRCFALGQPAAKCGFYLP